MTQSFRVNSPTVIQETIDDEVIIANLDQGFYYSIDQLGVSVWNAMVAGATVMRIVESVAQHFGASHAEIEPGISLFFEELQKEKLIVPADVPADESAISAALQAGGMPAAYKQPELSKYTDMQQLLLLDPIHEVDETGWPAVPEKPQ